MIRDWLKDWMTNRRLQKVRLTKDSFPRNTLNYHQVNQIGIIFHLNGDVDSEPLARFIKRLEQDHKKLKVLTYLEHYESRPYQFYFDYFQKSDINWKGEVNSPKMNQFIDTQFDFLFCIESEPQPIFDLILSKTKANCRIGLYDDKRTNLFELMVQNPDWRNLNYTLDQMLRYTKLLIYND